MHWFLSKTKVPKKIPKQMQEVVSQLRQCKNQQKCLEKAYSIMTKKYFGEHFGTYLRFFRIFDSDLKKMWLKDGFMHCHNLNYLMRVLLVKSGFFDNENIKNKWTTIWLIFPHQYLKIGLENGKSIEVDVWGASHRIKLGDHSHGFH